MYCVTQPFVRLARCDLTGYNLYYYLLTLSQLLFTPRPQTLRASLCKVCAHRQLLLNLLGLLTQAQFKVETKDPGVAACAGLAYCI